MIAIAALLSIAILVANELTLDGTRASTLRSTEGVALGQSSVLAEEVQRSFDSLDLAITMIVERVVRSEARGSDGYEAVPAGLEMHNWLRDRISGMPHVDAVVIVGANGDLLNSTRSWPLPILNVANRDYFVALRDNQAIDLFVSQPLQVASTGNLVVNLARRLTGANGEFLGIVLGSVSVRHLETLFQAIFLREGTAAGLLRADGKVLASYPNGADIAAFAARVQHWQRDARTGAAVARVDADRNTVRLASKSLARYPVRIVVSERGDLALKEWSALARLSNAMTSGCVVFILLTTLAISRSWREQEDLNERLEAQNVRFDMALENMNAGLFLADANEKLIVCNDAFRTMYQLPKEMSEPGRSHTEIVSYIVEKGIIRGGCDEAAVQNRLAMHEQIRSEGYSTRINELADGRLISVHRKAMPNGGWIAMHADISDRRRNEQKILHMARHDALTDLPNRNVLHERIQDLLRDTAGTNRSFAVLMIDLDRFKEVNDTLGHPVGDDLLRAVSERLRASIRHTATVGRLGGDEFAVIEEMDDPVVDASALAERLQAKLCEPFMVREHQVVIGASIGIAIAPTDGTEADELLKNSDLALYRAKTEGRGQHHFFEPEMDRSLQARRELEQDLRRALQDGQLELHYQPIVDLNSNRISSCEALVRWRHPVKGMISPADFIPLAEETGLIGAIGEWVMRTACAEAVHWPEDVNVAVNISPAQFAGLGLTGMILNATSSTGLAPTRLEIEITETVMMRENDVTFRTLRQIHAMGISISLDDFGTGCSSLSHLRNFTFDKIKIDRSFVREFADEDHTSRAIVRSLIQLAATLNKRTVAEGIETAELRDLVRDEGCAEIQGYFISRPLPAADIRKLLGSAREVAAAAA